MIPYILLSRSNLRIISSSFTVQTMTGLWLLLALSKKPTLNNFQWATRKSAFDFLDLFIGKTSEILTHKGGLNFPKIKPTLILGLLSLILFKEELLNEVMRNWSFSSSAGHEGRVTLFGWPFFSMNESVSTPSPPPSNRYGPSATRSSLKGWELPSSPLKRTEF